MEVYECFGMSVLTIAHNRILVWPCACATREFNSHICYCSGIYFGLIVKLSPLSNDLSDAHIRVCLYELLMEMEKPIY